MLAKSESFKNCNKDKIDMPEGLVDIFISLFKYRLLLLNKKSPNNPKYI